MVFRADTLVGRIKNMYVVGEEFPERLREHDISFGDTVRGTLDCDSKRHARKDRRMGCSVRFPAPGKSV